MLHIFQYKYFQFPVSLSAMTLRIDNHKALSASFGFDHPGLIRSPHSTLYSKNDSFYILYFKLFQITNIVYRMT